ncbi:radical SAM protein [Candidatus Woesearchaeota archaeon]|nr:radical SAM protein [Candidatus Woesearchaeota archaeon]
MITARKAAKLGKAYLESLVHPLPLWVHLWITNRCNLTCDYCYVVDNHSKDPSLEKVQSWIAHSDALGAAIVAFMGGEPLLRKDLTEIVSSADQRNLMTYLTTNGKLLTPKRLEELAQAGLDILEISIDGYGQTRKSGKTLDGKETLIDWLEDTHRKYGMRFKIHQVLSPETVEETPNLLELVRNRRIPISFGIVYQADKTVKFNPKEKEKMEQALRLLIESKRKGLPIINPLRYFQDAGFSLEHPYRINCDIGKYMIQVSTNGKVYVCSKLKEESGINFLDINKDYFKSDQHKSKELLERCSYNCLSACAYTTNYFREKPLSFISAMRKG